MTARQEHKTSKALLDQQRVLAEFGEFALRAENLDGILNEACRLVADALRTDLAKRGCRSPQEEPRPSGCRPLAARSEPAAASVYGLVPVRLSRPATGPRHEW